MQERIEQRLIQEALSARTFAYAPYSGFTVGAALETTAGKIFTGCNIENSAFSPTNCAERTAFFKAISEGFTDFTKIAIVGGKGEEMVAPAPCGVCRQVMAEFCCPDTFEIIMARSVTDYEVCTLAELLPKGFAL